MGVFMCLAYFLGSQGFELRLASSLSVPKTREALHNSWDKNNPKDAQVILHLLRTEATQHFDDPVVEEMASGAPGRAPGVCRRRRRATAVPTSASRREAIYDGQVSYLYCLLSRIM